MSVHTQISSTSNLLGGFEHTSSLSTSPHDPVVSLGSLCVRSAFGETVQSVADALQTRGALTLKQLTAYIRSNQTEKISLPSIRASLLVLLQHNICTVEYRQRPHPPKHGSSPPMIGFYIYHPQRAVVLLRYAKFIEWTRKVFNSACAVVVETLLLAGRLRTIDVLLQSASSSQDPTITKEVALESFFTLVQNGYIRKSSHLKPTRDDDEGETEWKPEDEEPAKKKQKTTTTTTTSERDEATGEDPVAVSLIKSQHKYGPVLPIDTVWQVNIDIFHELMRAFCLGKMVAELYGNKVHLGGSIVTAALKYRAHVRHTQHGVDEDAGEVVILSPESIVSFLTKGALESLEKMPTGDKDSNLLNALKDLSQLDSPEVLRHVGGREFEVNVPSLLEYLHSRIVHQVVCDRFGETAGRIISIIDQLGWLESDKIAEYAMVPAKDTREILHRLYRARYCDLFSVSAARMPTPSNSIYLWRADRSRLYRSVADDIALALWNIRLRRQHQMEVGKEWVARAQQAHDTDENSHETDRVNYQRFCVGLERLDNAVLQLDETLMIFSSF